MITLCLYLFKKKLCKMLSQCYRGVSMAKNKIQTGIRFDPELLYKISYIAKFNLRSTNAQFEYLAQKCVKEFEQENGEIIIDDETLYHK